MSIVKRICFEKREWLIFSLGSNGKYNVPGYHKLRKDNSGVLLLLLVVPF